MTPKDLVKGRKYRIVYRIPGVHVKNRAAVAQFLDLENGVTHWSGRPVYGTSTLAVEHIKHLEEVPGNVRPFADRIIGP